MRVWKVVCTIVAKCDINPMYLVLLLNLLTTWPLIVSDNILNNVLYKKHY